MDDLASTSALRARALGPGGLDDTSSRSSGELRRAAWLALLDFPTHENRDQGGSESDSAHLSLMERQGSCKSRFSTSLDIPIAPSSSPVDPSEEAPPTPPDTPLLPHRPLEANKIEPPSDLHLPTWRSNPAALPPHPDEGQVKLDVRRSLVSYCGAPSTVDRARKLEIRKARRAQLYDVIVSTLRTHPSLTYYQGYHDVVAVLLLTLVPFDETNSVEGGILFEGQRSQWPSWQSEHRVKCAVSRVSLHMLRDHHSSSLDPALGHLRLLQRLLPSPVARVVAAASPDEDSLPFFALSWPLTWFCHGVPSLELAQRVMDSILALGPKFVLALGAAMLARRAQELELEDMEDLMEDPMALHHALQQLPQLVADPLTSCPTGPCHLGTYPVPLPLEPVPLSTVLRYALDLASHLQPERIYRVAFPSSVLISWDQTLGSCPTSDWPLSWDERDRLATKLVSGPIVRKEALVPEPDPTPTSFVRTRQAKSPSHLILRLATVAVGAMSVGLVLYQSRSTVAAEAWRLVAAP